MNDFRTNYSFFNSLFHSLPQALATAAEFIAAGADAVKLEARRGHFKIQKTSGTFRETLRIVEFHDLECPHCSGILATFLSRAERRFACAQGADAVAIRALTRKGICVMGHVGRLSELRGFKD